MSGRLKTKGNMMLATKLGDVLQVGYKCNKLSLPVERRIDSGNSLAFLFRPPRPRLSSERGTDLTSRK